MIEVTAIKLAHTKGYPFISHLQWRDTKTNKNGESSRQALIDYVRLYPNRVYVQGLRAISFLTVVEARTPFLRTRADRTITDNLLSLPRY